MIVISVLKETRLNFNKANVSDTEASFMDLHLSIADGFVKANNYDKRDYFDFYIVNFTFLDGEVSRSASYGIYISQFFVLLECLVMLMTLILVIKF